MTYGSNYARLCQSLFVPFWRRRVSHKSFSCARATTVRSFADASHNYLRIDKLAASLTVVTCVCVSHDTDTPDKIVRLCVALNITEMTFAQAASRPEMRL